MSDVIENLPTKPNETNPPQTLSGINRSSFSLSVSEIKDFISPKLYGELSWDENRSADEVTEDCIEKAITVTETLLHLVDQELNDFSQTQKLIAKNITVSKLYEYNGDKTGAKEFLSRAERLISDRYRNLEKIREADLPFIALSKKKGEKK